MFYLFGFLLTFVSVFLIVLIMIQRGKGGGLTGALGGAGGQSAFGAKAGDTITYVTAITALVWLALGVAAIKVLSNVRPDLPTGFGGASSSSIAPVDGLGGESEAAGEAAPGTVPDLGDLLQSTAPPSGDSGDATE